MESCRCDYCEHLRHNRRNSMVDMWLEEIDEEKENQRTPPPKTDQDNKKLEAFLLGVEDIRKSYNKNQD